MTEEMQFYGNPRVVHRRLASTPAYGDFLVIFGLSLLFLGLLKILLTISQKWQRMMLDRVKAAIAKRRNTADNFRTQNGYSWDYVMVFKVYDSEQKLSEEQIKYSLKHILGELASGGLETRLFYSVQVDEVYCKIRCPIDRLLREADRINMKLPLNPDTLRALCNNGRPGKWDALNIPEVSEETKIYPYDYIYGKYEHGRAEVAHLYKVWGNGTVLRGCDRLKLIQSILSARKYEGGCFLDVHMLSKEECILGYFPLHDYVELRSLEEKWLRFCQLPWNQPVDDVKDYFGEKIGLYFLWLGHYTAWLIPASVVGFGCWINVAAKGNDPNAVVMPYFAAFLALWSTLFLESWKRKEKTYAMRWGMVGYEEEETSRPQFIGVRKASPVTGKPYLFFSREEKHWRLIKSSSIIFGFIIVVIGVVASIFVLRLVLSRVETLVAGDIQLAGIICSLLNAVQIQVLNTIYGWAAVALNNYENHRTDTQYEDNLIAKTFVFQFVNSFAALIYVAFFKPFLQESDPCLGSCMKELQTTLGTIFITRLVVGNLTEVGVPYFMQKKKEKDETEGAVRELSEVEKNFIQDEYHVMMGPFNDYAEEAIQYGYTTMFVAAFPLAAFMSFVSNYIELRVDAWKLCQQSRRPEPRSAEDIGTWQAILELISLAAVLSNSAMVAYTGTYAVDNTWTERAWIFIGMSWGIITMKYILSIIISDEPADVAIQLKRQEYIVSKVFDDVPDDDDESLVKDVGTKLDYTIRITDDDPL